MMHNITVGIDIGTYQIKVVVAELVKNGNKKIPRIIATGLAESKGMRHGYILNVADVTASINVAVAQAEKTAGIKIRKAFVAIGGIGLQGVTSTGSIVTSRADLEITNLDIEKVSEICEQDIPPTLVQNRKILHAIPISYKIDSKSVPTKTPLGMKGVKLEVKTLFVTCLEPHLNDLMQALDDANIYVVDVMASPIAASFVTLNKTQKIAGCVLANIGAETISIVVYENNIPISLEVFPIGSNDITNDIALGLKIPLEEAENIKIGSIGSQNYPKKKLEEIINARLSDMFELIENHLKKMSRNGLLPAGILITGGGGNIGTIEDLAKAALKIPSRIAQLNLPEQKNRVKDSTWAVAYGLCVLGFSDEGKDSLGNRGTGADTWKKIGKWLKQFLP